MSSTDTNEVGSTFSGMLSCLDDCNFWLFRDKLRRIGESLILLLVLLRIGGWGWSAAATSCVCELLDDELDELSDIVLFSCTFPTSNSN